MKKERRGCPTIPPKMYTHTHTQTERERERERERLYVQNCLNNNANMSLSHVASEHNEHVKGQKIRTVNHMKPNYSSKHTKKHGGKKHKELKAEKAKAGSQVRRIKKNWGN